ncbi:uncharacterized protein LOC142181190 [Nicotiana tabacum]|uniref:Uncharacterized protein LOC142181190 n=2 Tax=Nicotiana TaxID=4085 RepID=A0AC58UK80_TOBAC|nr:PREDICTED: uncharacterized protein LOC104222800 [Nicotiana sylvestris]
MVDLSQAPVMSRFSGENPLDWVLRAEQYFTFYNISSEHKMSWASFYMDGEALKCYHWLFRNKQLAGWDHFVDKLFIHFRGRNRDAPDRRLAILRNFTTVDVYSARAAAIPSWNNMANSPLPQYWNAHAKYTNLNVTHKVFVEKPNRESKTVIVTETMLPTPEETCNSVLDKDKEEADSLLPQYLVAPSEYNSNNGARKVFDELSNCSKDAIQEPIAMQEPQKELNLTHFPNDSMYHVAPTDASNDNANVVENEDKDNKEKVVTAIIEKAPLWIGSASSISSNLDMMAGRYGLGLAQNLEAMSCMLSACTFNHLLNRGNWNGATVSLTIENHDLGIQFFKWFDTGHHFKVDSGCTSLPNDPLSFVSDSLTSFKKIAKRRRGLIAMSCFELVSNMECTPVFGFPMLLSTDCATNGNICHSDSI